MVELPAPSSSDNGESKKQNIRNPDDSSMSLEIKVNELVTFVIKSDRIDIKGAVKSGGFEIKVDNNGKATIKGEDGQAVAFDGLNVVGLEREMFKNLTFSFKKADNGNLEWGAKVKFYERASIKLQGTLELNPMNGILGPSLERMKNPVGDL